MSVVKLDSSHSALVYELFDTEKYMGTSISNFESLGNNKKERLFEVFCSTYLSGLNSFHSYGWMEDNKMKSLISFYESADDPSWYFTLYRSCGNNNLLKPVLDKVIEHNENNDRYKFYSLINTGQKRLYAIRRFLWSDYNNNRYDYIDEYMVPATTRCNYTIAWEILFRRSSLPVDTVVRCSFLKNKFRKEIPKASYK